MSFLCDIFNFLLGIFVAVVDVIVAALNALVTGVITVLSTIADELIGGGLVPWLVGGVIAYFLLFGKDDDESKRQESPQVAPSDGQGVWL